MLFVGAFERQLDDKGRLAMPATFEEEAEAMAARVRVGEVSRNQLRALASSAILVSLDKQGRVNLDEQLRGYADLALGEPVTVAGSFDRLELWSPQRFALIDDDGTAELTGPDLAGSE